LRTQAASDNDKKYSKMKVFNRTVRPKALITALKKQTSKQTKTHTHALSTFFYYFWKVKKFLLGTLFDISSVLCVEKRLQMATIILIAVFLCCASKHDTI